MATSPLVPTARVDAALLILRVLTGVIFIAHGAQKLFVFGVSGITAGLAQAGVPLPALAAPAVSLLEFFGGIALALGLLTRLVSLGLAIDMLSAMLFVHLKNGFFLPDGFEFVLTLMGLSIAFLIGGGGGFSLDAFIASRRFAR